MSTQGKIKTLFSDKEKTEALFPRTKISAVSDENGKGLNAILDDMAYVGDITEDVANTPVNADLLGGRPAGEYATQNYVANEIAKAQLEGDDVDLSGYATKDEVSAAIRAIDYPVDSVNGRTGAITLSADDVGAHPNTWLPTPAQIGAAPSGYGLGTLGTRPIDLNACLTNGWYWLTDTTLNVPTEFIYSSVFVRQRLANQVTQYLFAHLGDSTGCQMIRRTVDGGATWIEEWVNPLMALGVEYRTTERWNGKVVYTMLVNINSIATGTSTAPVDTTVDVTVNGITKVVEYQVYITWNHETVSGLVYTASPNADNGIIATWTYARPDQNKLRVGVKANADVSGKTAHAIVKYTKD